MQPISPALYLYIRAAETLRKWRETCVVSQARPSRGEGLACETKTYAQHLAARGTLLRMRISSNIVHRKHVCAEGFAL